MTDLKFHGKQIDEKSKLFDELLQEINNKHIDYFKSRKSPFTSDKNDNIRNHCGFTIFDNVVNIMFPDKDTPDYIKQECIEAFNKSFN